MNLTQVIRALKFVTCGEYCFSIPSILKSYGAHLKPSAAMVRLRLYDVLSLLPPQTYEGMNFPHRHATWKMLKHLKKGKDSRIYQQWKLAFYTKKLLNQFCVCLMKYCSRNICEIRN